MKELLISGRFAVRECLAAASSSWLRWASKPRFRYFNFNPLSSSKLDTDNKLSKDYKAGQIDQPHATLTLSLCFYLREPLATVLSLLRKNNTFLRKVEKTRNSYGSSKGLQRYIGTFEIVNSRELRHLYRSDPRSRILASFHFGDFPYGLNKLIAAQSESIDSKVLSQSKYSVVFQDNIKRAFGAAAPTADSQLLYDDVHTQVLAGFLRRQSANLLMFADLPSTYGEAVRVRFLGRWAWFPKSIAVLCLVNKVPVLPVICYSIGKANYVEVGRQIEPVRRKDETREAAIGRITQLIVEFFEYFFRQHQQQWRYLTILPSYFVEPSKESVSE